MSSRTIDFAGRSLTRIGLGTNRLTNSGDNRAFLTGAVEAGINLVDTAHLYTGGESERTIGATLAPFPDEVVVATKGGYRPGDGRPERLGEQLEQSLERLRTDRITLYYLHRVDPETPLEETMAFLKDRRDAGLIEHIGLSEVSIEQIEAARSVVEIAAVQNEYNLAERTWDVVDYCEAEGILFVPFYPLHGADAPALREIAARNDATPSQVALAWLLRRSPAILPIPGTLSIDHARENLAALELELSDEDFLTLDESAN